MGSLSSSFAGLPGSRSNVRFGDRDLGSGQPRPPALLKVDSEAALRPCADQLDRRSSPVLTRRVRVLMRVPIVAVRRRLHMSTCAEHKALDQVGAFSGPLLLAGVAALTGVLWPGFAILAIPGGFALLLLAQLRRRAPFVAETDSDVNRRPRPGSSPSHRLRRLRCRSRTRCTRRWRPRRCAGRPTHRGTRARHHRLPGSCLDPAVACDRPASSATSSQGTTATPDLSHHPGRGERRRYAPHARVGGAWKCCAVDLDQRSELETSAGVSGPAHGGVSRCP